MNYTELESQYYITKSESFRTFISTLRKLKSSGEMTALDLSLYLGKISDNELSECRAIGMKGSQMTSEEKQRLTKAAMLAACCVILLCEIKSRKEIRNKTMLLLEYISYLQAGDHDLLDIAGKVCSYTMVSPGIALSLLEIPNNIDIVAYNLIHNSKFDTDDKLSCISIDDAGAVTIKDGVISLSSAPSWEPWIKSFSDHEGKLEVFTRNARDEKLKASDVDEVVQVENFAKTFLISQEKTSKSKQPRKSRSLECGKEYIIKIALCTENGEPYLGCIPIGVDGTEQGYIATEELVKGLYTEDLIDYFCDDDYLEGAVLYDDATPAIFSIKNTYVRYAKAMANKDFISKRVYYAKVVDFYTGKTKEQNRVILISDKGYGGLMIDDGTLQKGDEVVVCTKSIQDTGVDLFINMSKPSFEFTESPVAFDADDILAEFVTTEDDAANKEAKAPEKDRNYIESREIVRSLATILSSSRERRSIVRYRDILCSAFLFNIIKDETARDRVLSRAEYLNKCLRAAEGIPVKSLSDTGLFSDTERHIVNILASLGNTRDICEASSLIQGIDGAKEKEIARLFLSHTLAGINQDDLNASQEELRRKICALIGVGDHFKGNIRKGGGKYGKGELENVEFKSSYVFYNRDGQPDIFKQGRGQVLEAVCGFMNRDGGTVYVGVNDSGDPLVSETYGLNADINWFRSHFNTVNMMRRQQLGHNVPQPENLDSYCRFINSELELYFKPAVRNCVSVSPTEDMDAIRITVKPSKFEIAKLYTDNTWKDGCVYVREGEETKPMSRHDQEQRLMNLRSVGKVEQFIITLTEAIDKHQKVILKNYASGNSNRVSDRFVVPINLVYNDENLWAYDLEKKDFKEFRLARIESIEVKDEQYSHAYPKGEADVFRWVNPKLNYHIKLKLSLLALNNLKEEYSNVKNLPEEELYQVSPERWILDTHLHGLGAVRRFYLGLADQIEILDTEDSEELKKYIKEYVISNLSPKA